MPSATLINALPVYVSPEEHRSIVASTPVSFADIPAILRHKEEPVAVHLDPPLSGFTAEDASNGALYVIENVLVFMSTTGRGFQIEYPAITLHAISRSPSGPSIYCQLDENAGNPNAPPVSDDVDTEMRELSIIPQNPNSLESIFEALSLCAALHPDAPTASDEEDDEVFINTNNFETLDGSEEQELSEAGRAALAHLESIIYDPHHNDVDDSEQPLEVDANTDAT